MQERVAAVKPYWETISQEARTKILAVSVTELKQKAAELAEKQRKQAGQLFLCMFSLHSVQRVVHKAFIK